MFTNLKSIIGHKLAAMDGDIGQVQDCYFDDKTWAVRYLVAATGNWLTGRQVLLSPYAFGDFDHAGKVLPVKLTRRQIENCPPIDRHRPVSRQYEDNYHRYFGWPPYWQGDRLWGLTDAPAVTPASPADQPSVPEYDQWDDIHLRSTQELKGYQLHALDGPIGAVSSSIVDDERWALRDLVVETGHWYSGREVLIATDKIDRISYAESQVFVNLTKDDIQRTGENEVVHAYA
jgi:hypothetical protein